MSAITIVVSCIVSENSKSSKASEESVYEILTSCFCVAIISGYFSHNNYPGNSHPKQD
jgi:hypothetical protein